MSKWTVLIAVCWCGWAAGAHAQDAPSTEQAARQAFESGVVHAGAGRWADAAEAFRRSNALKERPSTWFNLTLALFRGERMAEALDAAERFLALAGDTVAAGDLSQIEHVARQAEAEVAELELELLPESASVSIDGTRVPGKGSPRKVRLDPGSHTLSVRAAGFAPHELGLTLHAGERARRSVTLQERTAPRRDPTPTPAIAQPAQSQAPQAAFRAHADAPPDEGGGLLASPWFWTVASVVVVSAAVTAGVLLMRDDPEPTPTTTGWRL
jgi:tetratricopeptide (TPR) repeat protein